MRILSFLRRQSAPIVCLIGAIFVSAPVAFGQPATDPSALKIPKPSGNLQIKFGETGTVGFGEIPMIMTAERLSSQGWKVESVRFAQTELATEAAAKGDVQFGGGAVFSAFLAIQKGAKLTLITEGQPNDWVLVAKKEIKNCGALKGRRLAIHSEGGTAPRMTTLWIERTCNAKPKRLVISGSANRAIALMNDQIEVTHLQLSDWIDVDSKQPGKFHLLANFAEGLDLITGGITVNTDWLEKNRPIAVAYVAELLKTNRMIAASPNLLEEIAKKHLTAKTEAKTLKELVKAYMAIGGWAQNGGVTPKRVDETIKFFTGGRGLKPGLKAEDVTRFDISDEALKLIGKVPGKR